MMTGGAPFALSLPFDKCIVPDINGPVYIYIVNGTQPLLNSQTNQAANTILAGPILAFIDSIPETLGQVVKAAPSTVVSSQNISSSDAAALIGAAQSVDASTSIGTATATSTVSAAEGSSTAGSTSSNGAIEVIGWSSVSASASSTDAGALAAQTPASSGY